MSLHRTFPYENSKFLVKLECEKFVYIFGRICNFFRQIEEWENCLHSAWKKNQNFSSNWNSELRISQFSVSSSHFSVKSHSSYLNSCLKETLNFEALFVSWRNSRGWERAFVFVLICQGQDSIKVGANALRREAKFDPETFETASFR